MASHGPLEASAASAFHSALIGPLTVALRAELAEKALLAAAAAANKPEEADDAYLTALAFGSSFTPAMRTWFDRGWGLDEQGVRDLIALAR